MRSSSFKCWCMDMDLHIYIFFFEEAPDPYSSPARRNQIVTWVDGGASDLVVGPDKPPLVGAQPTEIFFKLPLRL